MFPASSRSHAPAPESPAWPSSRTDAIGRASSELLRHYWGLVLAFLLCVGGASGYDQWMSVQRNARTLLHAYASEYAAQTQGDLDRLQDVLLHASERLARPDVDAGAQLRHLLRLVPHARSALLLDAQGQVLQAAGEPLDGPARDARLSEPTRRGWASCPGQRLDCLAPPIPDPRRPGQYLVGNLHRLDAGPARARWLLVVQSQVTAVALSGLRGPYPQAAVLMLRSDDHLLQMRDPPPSRRGFGQPQTGILVRELQLHPQATEGWFEGAPTSVGHRVLGVYVRRADLPFVVAVNLPFSALWTSWLRAMAPILAALLGSAVLGTWLLFKGLRGLREAGAAREASQEALRAQIRYNQDLALRDALTGLLNRRGMDARLADAIERARGGGDRFGMILLDLDRFKVLNDSYGHQAGDEVLRAVGALLREQLREQDSAARWGGEEFSVLLPHSDLARCLEVAERLRRTIAELTLNHRGHNIHLTASFGVAVWEGAGCSSERLLSRLDALLYDAKRAGRNQVRGARREASRSLSTGSMLQQALQQQRLRVAYQKLIDLRTGQVVGEEALARIVTPGGELLEAGSFIDAAHQLRLEHRIDELVSRQALGRCARRMQGSDMPSRLLINCSADFLSRPDMVQALLEHARSLCAELPGAAQQRPKPVVIEITERQLLGNLQETRRMLQPLVDFGFELAVDDFGSGYSSFLYLLELPVRYLKMEKELVQRAVSDPRARAMVESIRAMAAGLGIATIAEGIETEQAFELMRRLGIDWGQGYLWGRAELG